MLVFANLFCFSFAQNAKKIENQPQVNEKSDDKSMMRRMQQEIKNLRGQLKAEKSRNREVSKHASIVCSSVSYRFIFFSIK